MSRAFTLLEILLATAMLALVAMASTGLVQMVSRARARHEAPLRWQAAADRTLDLIATDLRRADIGIVPESVIATGGELRLASRGRLRGGLAPAEIIYRLDDAGRLRRELHPLGRQLGARGQPEVSSIVLGDITAFAPARDEDRSALILRIAGPAGELRRTVKIP